MGTGDQSAATLPRPRARATLVPVAAAGDGAGAVGGPGGELAVEYVDLRTRGPRSDGVSDRDCFVSSIQ